MTPLKELHDRVKAGTADFDWTKSSWPRGLQSELCAGAYNGSLDAAKALHDAVLPEWPWHLKPVLTGKIQAWTDEKYGLRRPGYIAAHDDPARAWLLAILRALIDQAQENGRGIDD